jgi:hypothetical protein
MFKEENIEKNYLCLYDCVNKGLDKLRKIVLLHDIPSLLRTLTVLIFIVTFGSYFSSLTMAVMGKFNLLICSC